MNPGSGSKPFTPERARAAASKRWSAAAAPRRAKGVPSLASLPGAAAATLGGDESVASSALVALGNAEGRSSAAGTGLSGKGTSSPAASRSAAIEAATAAKGAAVLARANAPPSRARTAAATKAATAPQKTTSGGKIGGSGRAGYDGSAVQIVGGAHGELEKVSGEVARLMDEVRALRTQVVNLTATVKINTQQIDTHGHSLELQACSIGEIKVMARANCKPAPRPLAGSDRREDGDDNEEPPRKRVRFALDVQAAHLAKETGADAGERSAAQSPPPGNIMTAASPVIYDEQLLGRSQSPTPPMSPEKPTRVPPSGRNFSPRNQKDGNDTARLPRSSQTTPVLAPSVDPSKRRSEGTVVMQGIRDMLKPRVSELIADATLTADVFLDPESRFEMILETAMESMDATPATANAFLLEIIDQPTKKRVRGSSAPRAVRACAPLGMVFSHAMSSIKTVVVAGWFAGVNSTARTMSISKAREWQVKRKYGQSEGGRVGVIAASKRMFKHLGARYRIKEPTKEGDVVVVHETLGHYALICTMVSEALDMVITGTSTGGPDGDRFKRYVDEAVSLDSYLPKHNRPNNGLAIVDGDDPNRAVFPMEYMPVPGSDMAEGAAAPPVAEA